MNASSTLFLWLYNDIFRGGKVDVKPHCHLVIQIQRALFIKSLWVLFLFEPCHPKPVSCQSAADQKISRFIRSPTQFQEIESKKVSWRNHWEKSDVRMFLQKSVLSGSHLIRLSKDHQICATSIGVLFWTNKVPNICSQAWVAIISITSVKWIRIPI